MFQANTDIAHALGEFKLDGCMFRYNQFIPKLYNYCKSLGFEMDKIMPSRAFCSDENQGYPIILMAKHFRTFPFNHGRVGGVMATVRHGPHASHGKDMVIVQASHVGYQPDNQTYGHYRRLCTEHQGFSLSCGKLASVIDWYQAEYEFAKNTIFLQKKDNENFIIIDNQLIDEEVSQGILVNLEAVAQKTHGEFIPHRSHSTSKCFKVLPELDELFQSEGTMQNCENGKCAIGKKLRPEFFHFKHELDPLIEGVNLVEYNLLPIMPWIVTSSSPLLTAAKVNVQVEFDRTFRTIAKEKAYMGKRMVYVAGLNIDISPTEDQVFPMTMFVPWAMYVQYQDGEHKIFEQSQIVEILNNQSVDNPDQLDLDVAINMMEQSESVKVVDSK